MSYLHDYFLDKELPEDSLDMIDFIMDIEDHFNIVITQSEASEIKTIQDINNLVERKLKHD